MFKQFVVSTVSIFLYSIVLWGLCKLGALLETWPEFLKLDWLVVFIMLTITEVLVSFVHDINWRNELEKKL